MPAFEDIQTVPRSSELVDTAFSRAARAGRAKEGIEAQESMLVTAANVLSDNLENVVTNWPDFDAVDPFYRELADAVCRDSVERSPTGTGSRPEADDTAVGKSSFVNGVTNARNETASYPFTTTQIRVGHVTRDRIRYQLVDTPGLLDQPADQRNAIEQQAVSALAHLADAVLFVVDASGDCGYPVAAQLELRDELRERFAGDADEDDDPVPVVSVCNKSDRSRDIEADAYMSVTEDENVDAVLDLVVEAVGYEPGLPFDG